MATATKVHLTLNDGGVVRVKAQTQEAADKASQTLQENHDKYHIYYNHSGFHNHIAHNLLTLYGIGASPSSIESAYKRNASYQLPHMRVSENIVQDMHDSEKFDSYLGRGARYHDFLVFFESELEKKGVEKTMLEYVFGDSDRAKDMLVRMLAGFYHPIIHLGFGLEFNQPAIIAESLAEAAVHNSAPITPFFAAVSSTPVPPASSQRHLPSLISTIHNTPALAQSAKWSDNNKVYDGVFGRAFSEIVSLCSQWRVANTEADLRAKTAEMVNAAVWFAAAAQRPEKAIKFDFYFMHCVNVSIFWRTINALPWLGLEQKCRLLEYKAWYDLAMYASRRAPVLRMNEITGYKVAEGGWESVWEKIEKFEDDGHAVKLVRAVANAEEVCKEFENEEWCVVKGDMWLKIANMVVDSLGPYNEETWVRSAGFDEAWVEIKDRPINGHI